MDTTKRERYISITGHEPSCLTLMISRIRKNTQGADGHITHHYYAFDNGRGEPYSNAHQLVRAFRIACIAMYFVGLAKSEKETA